MSIATSIFGPQTDRHKERGRVGRTTPFKSARAKGAPRQTDSLAEILCLYSPPLAAGSPHQQQCQFFGRRDLPQVGLGVAEVSALPGYPLGRPKTALRRGGCAVSEDLGNASSMSVTQLRKQERSGLTTRGRARVSARR